MNIKNILSIFVLLFLISCKVEKQINIIGTFRYDYKYSDDKEVVRLNNDSTFLYTSYFSSCTGTWKYISKDSIIISSKEGSFLESISRGYITPRIRKIRILNENKLKMPIWGNVKRKYVILKRVK